jgi:hypothetical protein
MARLYGVQKSADNRLLRWSLPLIIHAVNAARSAGHQPC